MIRLLQILILLVAVAACRTPGDAPGRLDVEVLHEPGNGPRVLCVVAHPDDEIAFGGVLYKIATHLDGTIDLLTITNGEAGYKYSTLGERLYGLRLTDPRVGRMHLPTIRRRELIAGCRLLGVHRILFLGEQDHRYTLDPGEVLAADAGVWKLEAVRAAIRRVVAGGGYDFVLTHLPVPSTHGHHKAASILALEAVAELSPADRPVVLGVHGVAENESAPAAQLDGYPVTRIRTALAPLVFDREQKFGYRNRLDYQIVVNWAIAEHKSQGSFQQFANLWQQERYYMYDVNGPGAEVRAARLFEQLAEPQFAVLEYDDNGDVSPAGKD